MDSAIGRPVAGLLVELAAGGVEGLASRVEEAPFGQRPGAGVAARPDRPTGMGDQHLHPSSATTEEQQSGGQLGHRRSAGGAAHTKAPEGTVPYRHAHATAKQARPCRSGPGLQPPRQPCGRRGGGSGTRSDDRSSVRRRYHRPLRAKRTISAAPGAPQRACPRDSRRMAGVVHDSGSAWTSCGERRHRRNGTRAARPARIRRTCGISPRSRRRRGRTWPARPRGGGGSAPRTSPPPGPRTRR